MPAPDTPLIQLRGVIKDYRGLRPLRVQELALRAGERVALLGFDEMSSEVLVNLMTGAVLPDSGEVIVFGQATSTITSPETWVNTLDRFGLVSDRAVLMEQFTVAQNLALPLSLAVEPIPPAILEQVRSIAAAVGLAEAELTTATTDLAPLARVRLRLGRALALEPDVLLLEHPNATLSPVETSQFAADVTRVARRHHLATLVTTADRSFAASVAEQVLTLRPANGQLERSGGWRNWFSQ